MTGLDSNSKKLDYPVEIGNPEVPENPIKYNDISVIDGEPF